jgi:hypothetical protein
MATLHLLAQALQGSELQLFHRALSPGQLVRNLSNALLLDETLVDHPSLVARKFFDQPKQASTMFDLLQIRLKTRFWRISGANGDLASGALELIRDGVGGNPDQPGGEGRATKFITAQVGQRFLKNVRRQVFRHSSISYTTGDKRIDLFEIKLIEIAKLHWVSLRSFHQQTLVCLFRGYFCCRSSGGH